jgi:hypothetical protein
MAAAIVAAGIVVEDHDAEEAKVEVEPILG